MNPFFKIPTAVATRSISDLSTKAILTNDFFTPRIIYSKEIMPGSKVKVKIDSMTRALALYKPMFGDVETQIRAFFIPYRTVMRTFNHFITNSSFGGQNIQRAIFIYTHTIKAVLRTDLYSYEEETGGDNCDFYDLGKGYTFNSRGRLLYNILVGLGYKMDFAKVQSTDTTDPAMSALPLLSYFKMYLDYYTNPSDVTAYKGLAALLEGFNAIDATEITQSVLNDLLLYTNQTNYDLDYFTSAWDNPVGPTSNSYSETISMPDISTPNRAMRVQYSENGGPTVNQSAASSTTTLSQFLDTALHRVSDLFKRYQLSGIRPLDRYFAQRGIKLDSERLNRSIYLGHFNSPFQISDVMSTAETADEVLGQYAGKAINYNMSGSFNYDSSEFGHLIITCTIVPKIKYYQGISRSMFHLNRFDFFTPEFDMLGVQAIRADELFNLDNSKGHDRTQFAPDTSIGFTSRYAEYKCEPNALVAGDFILDSRNYSYEHWHLFREIQDRQMLSQGFKHTGDKDQYNRIFNFGTEVGCDPFFQVFNIDVKANQPCTAMFEDYEWSEQTGREVTIQKGGLFVN